MNMYKKDRSSREMENTFPQRRRTPSFSSSLLDAIYRSIDEPNGGEEEFFSQYRETKMIKKQSTAKSVSTAARRDAFLEADLRRDIMIESWMEKQSTRGSLHSNSTSSSSDSSSGAGGSGGGVFSSSEAESSVKENSTRVSILTPQRINPLSEKQQKPKCEGGFTKTKLRALKIYGELKKVKQPISPGGRIASFLNSIFNSGSGKKVKLCSIGAVDDVSSERKSKSACSSVTSFSRSCLSKTPPSRGKQSNRSKRSVRFYPVTVIVDEDSRPCGHKCIYEDDPGLMPMPIPQKIAKSSSLKGDVVKGANYIRKYQKKNISEFDFRGFHSYVENHEDSDDEEEDDDESCSSSDLFELDHLIGIGRYREELPVYETTSLKTNQAIANGLML
ncbi:protein BIG GRAIN 1-like C [Manihot esculenta]|nr:protein BIG GRAIN 1-like C [Manihot esculenta]